MVSKQIGNPQALYGLAWDENGRIIARYVNGSGRNMFTGDAVCLVQTPAANTLVAALTQGGLTATPVQPLANTTAGAAALIPYVSYSLSLNNFGVVGVVGTLDDGYIDSLPGGTIGTIGSGASLTNIAGSLPVGQICGPNEFAIFPAMSVVPVVIYGPARVNVSGQTTAVGSLLGTVAAAVEGSGILQTGTPPTVGLGIAIALEVNSHNAAGNQTGSGALSVTPVTATANTTAASATTIPTTTNPITAGFPTNGMIQFSDTGVIKVTQYTGLTAASVTGLSATAIATGIVAGTSLFQVNETIRAMVKPF
jgi:hypothetical protein